MTAPSSVRSRRSFDGSAVAVATSVMNVATYGFTMLAARIIGPSQYGAFVACLSLLIVVQVGALGHPGHGRATHRRRPRPRGRHRARHPGADDQGRRWRRAAPAACWSRPSTSLLNLDSLVTAAVVALAAVPLTLAGGQAGILQGERRWGALAVFYLAGGIPRLRHRHGDHPLASRRRPAALLGVGIGFVFPVLVGLVGAAPPPYARLPRAVEHSARSMLVESAHNAQVLFAYFALSSVDIVIARQVLSEHDAGLYAAGLIMAKVMLFLPQFVVVIAFPDMATPESRQPGAGPQPAASSASWASSPWLAAKVLSGVAMIFVGGADFAEVEDRLWFFAVLGHRARHAAAAGVRRARPPGAPLGRCWSGPRSSVLVAPRLPR